MGGYLCEGKQCDETFLGTCDLSQRCVFSTMEIVGGIFSCHFVMLMQLTLDLLSSSFQSPKDKLVKILNMENLEMHICFSA